MKNIFVLNEQEMDMKVSGNYFLQHRTMQGMSHETLYQNKIQFFQFQQWCSEKNIYLIEQLNDQIFREYLVHLHNRKNFHKSENTLSRATIKKHVDFLHSYGDFLLKHKFAYENYAITLPRPPVEQPIIQAFTDEQIQLIFNTVLSFRPSRKNRIPTIALTFLLFDTGLRISEALSIKPKIINFDTRLINIVGKGRKQRLVPFSPKMAVLFKQTILHLNVSREQYIWHSERTGKPLTGAHFRMVLKGMKKKMGSACGIDSMRLSPHTFRHTFAKNWIMNQGDPYSLQRILGHSSMNMTMRYVNLWGEDLVKKHDRVRPMRNLILSSCDL